MIKHIMAATAAIAGVAAFSAPAFALAATGATNTVSIGGNVAAICDLSGLSFTPVDMGSVNPDATYSASSKSVPFGATFCNGMGTTYQITAYPIVGDHSSSTAGFTNRLDYDIDFGAYGNGLDTTGHASSSTGLQTAGAFIAPASTGTIHIHTSGTTKLLAGAYSGHVDIVITPGV